MATIHSLPTELIHHTISLAYPVGTPGYRQGLAKTSLVHHSWLGPSQSILTQEMYFDGSSRRAIHFVETVPAGFQSQRVSFRYCADQHVRAILGKAKAGGIRALTFATANQSVINNLFNFSSLNSKQTGTSDREG